MSNVIASTKMKYKGYDVLINIYMPERAFLDSDEYACRLSIEGGEISYKDRSIGLDSMQALILSLTMIGTYINKNDDLDRSLIEWEGGPLDFPVFLSELR